MSHVLVVDSLSENLHFSAAKALYRRSLGYSALKEDDSAEKDLSRALELVPQDAAINAELDKVRARKKEKRDKGKGKAREEPDPSQSSGSSTRWGLRRRRASEDLVEERRLQEEQHRASSETDRRNADDTNRTLSGSEGKKSEAPRKRMPVRGI